MRELKSYEVNDVSGGSLTSVILDFFKQLTTPSQERTEWVRPDSVPAANPIDGNTFGMGILGVGIAGLVSAVAFGLMIL